MEHATYLPLQLHSHITFISTRASMEWLFGSSAAPPVAVDTKLSASSAQGRSAPSLEDDSWHKNRGNDHFKCREYEDAVREYSLGIDKHATATLYSNRSVCAVSIG
jgi:hypothetical protein